MNHLVKKIMKSAVMSLPLFLLAGCGYDGVMRYPCQSFENWEKPECNPPQCESTGVCTKDLLPPEVFEEIPNE